MQELTRKILNYLQKRHRLDILLGMFTGEKEEYSQKDFRDLVADFTFRKACRELESLGLVQRRSMDTIRGRYALTDRGVQVASILHEAIRNLDDLVKTFDEKR